MSRIFRLEPALILGFIGAVLFLLVSFGVPLSDTQEDAIQGVAGTGLLLGAALATRSLVTPVAKVQDTQVTGGNSVANPDRTRL